MLDFSFSRRVPSILQTEAAECGHACVAMVAGYHGHRIDLATLRERHSVSLRGSTLADLMRPVHFVPESMATWDHRKLGGVY